MGRLEPLVNLVTFPGVIVHEFAHERVCRRYDVPVFEVCYFRLGDPSGYVKHAAPTRYRDGFAISVAPFLVNTAIAVGLFGLFALVTPIEDASAGSFGAGQWLLFWLGISVAMHAVPSRGDAAAIWDETREHWRDSPVTLLGLPVVALIYAANLLDVLWFDAIYRRTRQSASGSSGNRRFP